jgi:hypothetical protein
MNVDYKIVPIKTSKDQIKQPKLAEAGVIPRLNTSTIIVGQSGSGKSVLVANLLTRPEFYDGGKAWDQIVLISPTCESDDVQKSLKIDPKFVFSDLEEAVVAIASIERLQTEAIKKVGAAKAKKLLLLCDDCVGDSSFMASRHFTDLFIKSRHYNVTLFFLSQHYRRLPKICRLQASFNIFFPCSSAECEAIAELFSPPRFTTKMFVNMLNDVFSEKYQFLSINMKDPFDTRFRRGLAQVLDLDYYRQLK